MTNMETNEMTTNRSFGLPMFLGGMGAGIALALLLAPQSGRVTRRLIGRKVKVGEDWIKDSATKTENYVVAQGEGIRDGAREFAEVLRRS